MEKVIIKNAEGTSEVLNGLNGCQFLINFREKDVGEAQSKILERMET